jgi:serine/threonine protein kinase
MELCDSDLQHHFQDHHNGVPFSEEEIKETFLQLNNGFKVMRKNNIIHRDLKLENIMIKYTDKEKKHFIPKISDYGLGKVLEYFNTNIQSDPRYMAPELVNNIFYNEKVDLWSVGCMIYELYYRDLYCNNYFPGKIKQMLNDPRNSRISNDPYFKDLLIRLLEENPNDRISWNDYFYHPFFMGNNIKERYEKISDFDLGFNCDKDLLQCYIAQDNKYNLKVLIKSYKLKESKALMTEENLKAMRQEYDSLKDSLLKDRANFRSELRLKGNIYNQDIIQTNLRTESLKHQVDNLHLQ